MAVAEWWRDEEHVRVVKREGKTIDNDSLRGQESFTEPGGEESSELEELDVGRHDGYEFQGGLGSRWVGRYGVSWSR